MSVVLSFASVTKKIAVHLSRASLNLPSEDKGVINIQGERQSKYDVFTNDLMIKELQKNKAIKLIASEEEPSVIACHHLGQYAVAFDPLDGSSNMNVNGQVGTIFSVLPALSNIACDSDEHFFQQGRKQVCAGYVLYGYSTILVLTLGQRTVGFTLDESKNEYYLSQPCYLINQESNEFSINCANRRFWSEKYRAYIDALLLGENGLRLKNYTMRWNGAMVSDVHRILCRGGIFMYPGDSRENMSQGKLRLLYEANPMALIIENAGGYAMTDTTLILDVKPKSIHQRVPVVLGSKNEVDFCINFNK